MMGEQGVRAPPLYGTVSIISHGATYNHGIYGRYYVGSKYANIKKCIVLLSSLFMPCRFMLSLSLMHTQKVVQSFCNETQEEEM